MKVQPCAQAHRKMQGTKLVEAMCCRVNVLDESLSSVTQNSQALKEALERLELRFLMNAESRGWSSDS